MLKVSGLNVKFRGDNGFFEAVKNVSFELKKGETIGIVGESGSGKSVTSLAVMRLLNEKETVISGSVSLEEENLFSLSEQQMRRIRGNRVAMIFPGADDIA